MSKQRPIGVTILAVLAAAGALVAIWHTLQMLGLLPIEGPLGKFKFFTIDWLGAILWGVLALIYIWVVRMLWNLDPQGWLFVSALSALNLVLALITIIGDSTWQSMLPSIIVNGLILIYSQLSGTKEAFGVGDGIPMPEEQAPPVAATAPEKPMEPAAEPATTEPEAAGAEVPEPEAELEAASPDAITGTAAHTHDLSYIEGIGEAYSKKLNKAGVDSPQALLNRGATRKGRKELAAATGISEKLVLKWVNEADLYRINGLGSQYAELMEAAGVDTVVELAQRNPENLYAKLIEVNEEHRHVRHAPSQAQVEEWVSQAKELPRVVTY